MTMAADSDNKKWLRYACVGWLVVALFYFYQYILRVAPGIMVEELRYEFQLTAEQFSTFGSFYLYAYALCQIPLGVLVDRIGVRRMVTGSLFLCIIGTLMLAMSQTLIIAQFSRILVGIGSASSFMCALKMVVDYFPAGKRGFLMGLTLTLGTVGALFAGKPLVMMIDYFDWRSTMIVAALLGILFLVMVFFGMRPLEKMKKERETQPALNFDVREMGQSVLTVLKNRRVMLYAILAIAVYTPLSVLADLWGVAFLMQKYQLPRAEAAEFTMMMYLGMAVGCIFLPWLSEKYHVLNRNICWATAGVFVLFAALLYGPAVSSMVLVGMLIVLGILCGAEMLCFTGASQYATARNAGTILGVVNTLNMLGGGLLQQFIGTIMDWLWHGEWQSEGVRHYSTQNYTQALSVLLVVVGICMSLSFLLPKDNKISSL